ncbi:cytospin-A-like isoform X5 [Penaeus chinensis]|uniref:cytospin-A-like isoform X5 n=1 Tax=Penaeus chinensis TaxID=139456 RepID=UPI001FB85629|nr:cytospin-A-like isoform X5 [Penaeus chinensis]
MCGLCDLLRSLLAPPRDLDRLRALSPLSQRCRRSPTMNPRTPLMLTPRGGSSSVGGNSTPISRLQATTPQASKAQGSRSIRAPSTPVNSNKQGRPLRVANTRPARPTTAVIASPRKASAPSKLISVLGGSLDNLPSTVSVRRKTSAPAKTLSGTSSSNNYGKKSSVTISARTRKTSSSSSTSSGSPTARMSKDHGGSSGHHGTKGSSSSSAKEHLSNAKEPTTKGGKKVSSSSSSSSSSCATSPDMQPLPTVKEEKRPPSSKLGIPVKRMENTKNKENASAAVAASAPASTRVLAPPQPTQPPDALVMPSHPPPPTGGAPATAVAATNTSSGLGSFPEKAQLEKTVSDLVKNAESKKQEIAALKIEINRLKEAAREREHLSDEENSKAALTSAPAGGFSDGPSKASSFSAEAPSHLRSTVQTLSAENKLLRDRLLQLGVSLDSSPLSDQEKELLLSKVSTISQNGGEGPSSCGDRGEWDNKSTSSVSEMSVACLQDRIQQMEETHYCTNEELQATLQELDDLREQLSECQIEVQQLQEEKQVILESLTQQTEKLNESRSHNDTLKQMLIQHSENSQDLSQCEKTQRLMELLKSAQEDRELLQIKQEELEQQIATTKEAEERFHHNSQLIRDRMKVLESMVETANNEKKAIETQLAESQEAVKATEMENTRLQAAVDSAKEKITELEAAVISGEKSELADLLERVRQEKDLLEKENAALQQKASAMACENERLKDQISSLQDELMVARNNARTQLEDAGWRKAQLEEERHHLEEETEVLRATMEDLKLTCQHHLEDKRDLKASLSESQKKLHEALEKLNEKERCFSEERAQFSKQVEEWEQFQSDLLMTVRVANDFKTEAQHDLERLTQENTVLRDRLKQLGQDLEKAKAAVKVCSPVSSTSSSSMSSSSSSERRTIRNLPTPMPNGEPSILADRRNPRPLARGDSRVKSLIESIECATRQTRAGSRSSSTSSLCSSSSESNNNNNNNNKTSGPLLKRADTEGVIRGSSTSPLKDAGNTLGTSSLSTPLRAIQRNSFTEGVTQSPFLQSNFTKPSTGSSNLSDNVKMSQLTDKNSGKISSMNPGENVAKPISILSNKLDHTVRRNSYGQISAVVDKKDPLASLAQGGGSKRNALLKWCQNKTIGYSNVDITNFSSSWNDGLALCALMDTYIPDKICYKSLSPSNKKRNFEVAISAAESVGVPNTLDVSDMITSERPNWQTVYNYVTSIFCHFET